MSGTHKQFNTSQDPDYVGPTGFEKKFHKTHFQGLDVPWNRTPIARDPNYIRVGPGRYKYIGQKRIRAGDEPEVT